MARLTTRVAAAGITLALLLGGGALATGALPSAGSHAAPETPADTATDPVAPGASTASPAERLDCENGTSDAVLACGFTPGPNDVSLADQELDGDSVTVEAVELADGGFVAIHRVSFVDGQFTESVVGVSDPLDAGLHRDVEVELDEELRIDQQVIAVVYSDSDGDDSFDFTATDGAEDRPYTNTYSERAGNVTDEAGEVIGDVGRLNISVGEPTVVPGGLPAQSLDGDSLLEDVDGDGDFDIEDVRAYFRHRNSDAIRNNPEAFDVDGDGTPGTMADILALYNRVR